MRAEGEDPMITSAIAAIVLLGGGSGSVSTALQHVNGLRKEIGLAELRLNASLNRAAEGHANYMQLNSAMSHSQKPGAKGFTGKSALERARAAGFKGQNDLEDLAF